MADIGLKIGGGLLVAGGLAMIFGFPMVEEYQMKSFSMTGILIGVVMTAVGVGLIIFG